MGRTWKLGVLVGCVVGVTGWFASEEAAAQTRERTPRIASTGTSTPGLVNNSDMPRIAGRELTLSVTELMSTYGVDPAVDTGNPLSGALLNTAYAMVLSSRTAALARFSSLVGLPTTRWGYQVSLSFDATGRVKLRWVLPPSTGTQVFRESRWFWRAEETGLSLLALRNDPARVTWRNVRISCAPGKKCIEKQNVVHVNSVTEQVESTTMSESEDINTLIVDTSALASYFGKLDETYTYLQTHPN